MGRPRKAMVEYRTYEMTGRNAPLHIDQGSDWHISPVESLQLHFHNCFEIGLCHTDSGTVRIGDERLAYEKGDVLCLASNVPHTIWSAPEKRALWTFVHLDPAALLGTDRIASMPDPPGMLKLFSSAAMLVRAADCPWAATLLRAMIDEQNRQDMGYETCIRDLCSVFFTHLLRLHARTSQRLEKSMVPSLSLAPALDYISAHYDENFPLDTLSRLCHISPTHFRRLFQEQTGTSPLAFLHQVRILKSCALLRTSSLDIAQISAQVGYTSLSCYNRHFKELIGCTPSLWRNMGVESQDTALLSLSGWSKAESDEEITAHNARLLAMGYTQK